MSPDEQITHVSHVWVLFEQWNLLESICHAMLSDSLTGSNPANTIRWTNIGLMLAHRLRLWANINPTLVQRLVFAGRGGWTDILTPSKVRCVTRIGVTHVTLCWERGLSWYIDPQQSVVCDTYWSDTCPTLTSKNQCHVLTSWQRCVTRLISRLHINVTSCHYEKYVPHVTLSHLQINVTCWHSDKDVSHATCHSYRSMSLTKTNIIQRCNVVPNTIDICKIKTKHMIRRMVLGSLD